MSGFPEELKPRVERAGKQALIVGVLAAVLCLVLGHTNRAQFFQSYLQAYLLWFGVVGGALALLMIQYLVVAGWGFVTRRILEAISRTLPYMALLFVPVLLGMSYLYHWTDPEAYADDEILRGILAHKSGFLHQQFFIARAIVYFVIWIVLARLLCGWSRKQDETGDETLNRPLRITSGIGIVAYALTITFASWDWTMSLDPLWFSSMWGPLFMVGQGLAALAMVIIFLARLSAHAPLAGVTKPKHFHDLGNLLFAFVILWSYMTFGQFLIIWSGNLPEEITWYLDRLTPGWKMVTVILALFHFIVPFFILLSRLTKLKARILWKVALFIFCMRLVDLFWIISPINHEGVSVHALDILLPVALGGIWIFLFCRNLQQGGLIPLHDPLFKDEVNAQEGGHHG